MIARPVLALLITGTVAALLLGAAGWYRAGQRETLDMATQARKRAFEKFRHAETEKRETALYQQRFMELLNEGLIGDERRLAWIEAIRQIQIQRKLVSATYEIEAQQALVVSGAAALGDYQVRGSRMYLRLGLVHEMDLFTVLDDLRAAGRFSVEACKLTRNDVPPDAVGVARLMADCKLVWLTMGSIPTKPGAP